MAGGMGSEFKKKKKIGFVENVLQMASASERTTGSPFERVSCNLLSSRQQRSYSANFRLFWFTHYHKGFTLLRNEAAAKNKKNAFLNTI